MTISADYRADVLPWEGHVSTRPPVRVSAWAELFLPHRHPVILNGVMGRSRSIAAQSPKQNPHAKDSAMRGVLRICGASGLPPVLAIPSEAACRAEEVLSKNHVEFSRATGWDRAMGSETS